jgi:hypothetical protein
MVPTATHKGTGILRTTTKTRRCTLISTESSDVSENGWIRPIAFVAAILFLVYWVFPVGAGLAKDTSVFPKWWGPLDVGLAFVLAVVAFGIQIVVRGNVDQRAEYTTYRIYRTFTHGITLVGVLVMLAGGRITWQNCATGFLWHTWLGLYILPWWLAASVVKNRFGWQRFVLSPSRAMQPL